MKSAALILSACLAALAAYLGLVTIGALTIRYAQWLVKALGI